jgi:beta-lactamase regulating signal transducer with metallopeptidase domain/uncharacterized protein involved in exopolysaccharide biosynthesis
MNVAELSGYNSLACRLGWALVHSLWQGALVAIVFAVMRATLRRCSANARYLAGCGMLALLAALPVFTFVRQPPRGAFGSPDMPGQSATHSRVVLTSHGRAFSPLAGNAWELLRQGSTRMEPVLPWVVMAWLAGVMVCSYRWLQGWWWVKRVKTLRTEPLEAVWVRRLCALKQQLGITRPVRLLRSTLVEVPVVIGWLRPVILLPASTLTGLTPAQIETILVHELAHVRRCDYLVNAFQNLVETILFYHPAVWWISRCIREEREHCCDDWVVRVCSDRVAYARALVTLEELRGAPAQVAFAASGGSLLRRVRRLLGVAENRPGGVREVGGLVLAGLGCIMILSGLALLLSPVRYDATCRLKVEKDSLNGFPERRPGNDFAWGNYDPYFVQTEFEVIQSPAVLDRAVQSLNVNQAAGSGLLNRSEALRDLRKHFELRPVRNTSLVEVRAWDEVPGKAARVANAIATAYHEYNERERRAHTKEAIAALKESMSEQEKQVREIGQNLDDLRVKLRVRESDPAPQAGAGQDAPSVLLSADTLRRLESNRIELKADLVRQQTLLRKLKELRPESLVEAITACGLQDAVLSSLVEQKTITEQRLIPLQSQLSSQHPDVKACVAQLDELRAKIAVRVDGIMLGLEARVESLQKSLAELEKEVEKAKYDDIKTARDWEAKRSLQERLQALSMRIASERTDLGLSRSVSVEIVDEAIAPERPFSPNRPRAAAFLTSGSLFVLIGLTLIKTRKEPVA